MEQRASPRFPFRMKAYALDTGREVTFESEDISAGGVYLHGNPRVPVGSSVWMRFEIATTRDGKEWVYPVDAEIEVVRVTRANGDDVRGFAGRWISVASAGSIEPLCEFLRRVLSMTAGFIQVVEPRNEFEKPFYVYAFLNSPAREGTADARAASGPDQTPDVLENPASFLDSKPKEGQSIRTGIYVVLPMTYRLDDAEYEGRAVKVREHGMRIATSGPLPEVYQRIAVRIPMKRRDHLAFLELIATVTTIRRGGSEGEGQFDVEFGLANDPDALATFRKILDRLNQTLSESRGL